MGTKWYPNASKLGFYVENKRKRRAFMGNMHRKIELVVLDLDGTLLASNGTLPRRNAEAVHRAQSQGVGVILATGKTRASAAELIAELGISLPCVFSQGLVVHEADGKVMREIALNHELVDDVFAYLDQQGLPYIVYGREGLLTPYFDDYNAAIYGKYGEPRPRIMGAMAGQAILLQVNKFLIGDKNDLQARRRDLERRFGRHATIYQAVPEYIEMIPKGLNKGAGVQWLLEKLQIDPETVMAIGDGENDIEMLQLVGLGVAMGNADQKLKAVADYEVASNDDAGVAEAFERFVFADRVIK